MRLRRALLFGLAALLALLLLSAALSAAGSSGANPPSSPSSPSSSPSPSPSAAAPSSAPSSPAPSPSASASPSASPAAVPALSLLALIGQLPVSQEQGSGYDRDLFEHWRDVDGDGCNARREVLIAESESSVSVGAGCSLSGGSWFSVYDGVRSSDAGSFDIDHFVPLKEAWDSGAFAWDARTRAAFANDLDFAGSLIAVTASSNRAKSDRDPAEWLPPRTETHCGYVATWVTVKLRWSLSVDLVERGALERIASGCPDSALAGIAVAPPATISLQPAGGAPAAPAAPGTIPRFDTCKAANAAGYGDFPAGTPEYDWYIDRDRDGVACER